MPIPGLNDKLREIASIVEGALLRREATIVSLRQALDEKETVKAK